MMFRRGRTLSKTAKLFTTGRSQAVRLPKEFRFEGQEVFIRREGGAGDFVTPPEIVGCLRLSRISTDTFLS